MDIFIPYETGMDLYSGLFELFEQNGILTKVGNRYKYVSKVTGEEHIQFRKNMGPELFDMIMTEFSLPASSAPAPEETTEED